VRRVSELEIKLEGHLLAYSESFASKTHPEENNESDILMEVFGITPELKRENKQYWGRELGMCFQRLVVEVARHYRDDFEPALKVGDDEPCDLRFGGMAIDTKYRVGSGDSGTLKKFKKYGQDLTSLGYEPVMLLLREDNLSSALTAMHVGGWTVYHGQQTFDFVKKQTSFNLEEFLTSRFGGVF
jgi:hypothetical protein